MSTAFLLGALFLVELCMQSIHSVGLPLVITAYLGLLWSTNYKCYTLLLYALPVGMSAHLLGMPLTPFLIGLLGIYGIKWAAYRVLVFPRLLQALVTIVSVYGLELFVRYYQQLPAPAWTFFHGCAILSLILVVLQARAYGN